MEKSAARPVTQPELTLGIVTYLCNLFDYAYTLFVLDRVPGAREANPIFALMLRVPLLALLFKLFGVAIFLVILYRCRARPLARFGLRLTSAAYALTVLYELTLTVTMQ